MGGLPHVNVNIIIGQYGTTGRRDADGFSANSEFVDYLSYESMDNAVAASRTKVKDVVLERLGSFEYLFCHALHLVKMESPMSSRTCK